MSGPTLIALVSLGVTVVTVIATFWERARTAKAIDEQRRRQLIADVIERLERVTRVQNRPVYLRMFANPELDLALALPRFTLLMKDDEQPLLEWLTYQSKRMQRASSDHEATIIGVGAVSELAKWFRGKQPLEWFIGQNKQAGTAPQLPPRRTLWRQVRNPFEAASVISVSVALAVAPSVIYGVLRSAWLGRFSGKRRRPPRV